jgi:hypothetical protein
MNCGAVVDPDSGAPARPYEMLRRWGFDSASAFRAIVTIARLPAEQAPDYLRTVGLGDERAAALLKAVECQPPQGFLVLSTGLLDLRGWLVPGFWDPDRAYAVELARHRYAPDTAVPLLEQRLGLAESGARDLYAAASEVRTEEERTLFAAPYIQTWSRDWQPCVSLADGLHCALDLIEPATGVRLQDLVVDTEHPEGARIRMLKRPMGAPIEATPVLVELAEPDRLRDIAPPGATVDLAVLADPERQRVFVGRPAVVRSTLVRLALLDGRYSPQFQKIFEQLGVDRKRITAWRIVWGQP